MYRTQFWNDNKHHYLAIIVMVCFCVSAAALLSLLKCFFICKVNILSYRLCMCETYSNRQNERHPFSTHRPQFINCSHWYNLLRIKYPTDRIVDKTVVTVFVSFIHKTRYHIVNSILPIVLFTSVKVDVFCICVYMCIMLCLCSLNICLCVYWFVLPKSIAQI